MKKWYDVHFSLNGFMKVEADDEAGAELTVEEILKEPRNVLEEMVKTGIGIEITDVLEEEPKTVPKNRVFKNGRLLSDEEIVEEAYALTPTPKVFPSCIKSFVMNRLGGHLCDCPEGGDFDLLPVDDPAVQEGGKRYMVCRKCGLYSHL